MSAGRVSTERVEFYPAGRNRVLMLAIKKQYGKKKRVKGERLAVLYLKSNPHPLTIVFYRNQRYPILFPSKLRLEPKEIDRALRSLLVLHMYICRKKLDYLTQQRVSNQIRLPKEMFSELRKEARRLQRWLKK